MIDLVQMVIESKAKKIEIWPVNSNRASEFGHPCERYLVYLRTRGAERALHDVGLQFVFDEGKIHEKAVLRDLDDAGIEVVEQQRPFEWKQYQFTGSIDAKIRDNGKVIPIEIKSLSEWSWKAINSIEDMFKHKSLFMRKYPAQLTLYLLMDNKEEGAFLLKNKQNGFLKMIPMTLDYALGESLVKKAERVNAHVLAGTLPERIPYEDGISGHCPFSHICLPDVTNIATLLDDPELESKLDRRAELKEASDEYDDLDKEIKAAVKEKPQVVVGKWSITGTWVERKELVIKASKYWKTTIKELKP